MDNQGEEKLFDIVTNPKAHRHSYNALITCCMVDGALDLSLIEAHGQHVDLGTNGGVKCDVVEGPCACGAWHKKDE